MFKSNPYKENGVMGKKRSRIYNLMTVSLILTCTIFLVILLLLIKTITISVYPTVNIRKLLLTILFLIVLIWFISNLIFGIYRRFYKKKCDFRKVKSNEWELIKNRNVIHYTSYLNLDKGQKVVDIPCHISPKVNHHLPKKYRNKGFVWFHLSTEHDINEPELISFQNAHFLEGNPRVNKLVIKLDNLPRERLFIELNTGYLLVSDDLKVEAEVFTDFKWYNDCVYYKVIIKDSIKYLLLVFYYAFRQAIILIEEKNHKSKLNKLNTEM